MNIKFKINYDAWIHEHQVQNKFLHVEDFLIRENSG